jgi:hypothetical protein
MTHLSPSQARNSTDAFNRLDVSAAKNTLADMGAKGRKPIPWEKVKKEQGLR